MTEADFMGILIFSEDKSLMLESLGKGREMAEALGTSLSAAIVSEKDDEFKNSLIHFGADKVIETDPLVKDHLVGECTDALASVIEDEKPEIVLIGSTNLGKSLAPRIASRLKVGCATDCIKLEIDESKDLAVERVVYGGNALSRLRFIAKPQIATIPPRLFEPLEKDESRKGELIKKSVKIKDYGQKVLNVSKRESEGVKIEDAVIIVSCGRGVKNREDLKLLQELAEVLNGEIGCSRPLASDLKWLSKDHWVGLSGHKVKPKLYFACGISGQIQHIAGMRDSDIVVAINKDADAPIFNAADYGIVGDLYKVVPALTEAFRKIVKS